MEGRPVGLEVLVEIDFRDPIGGWIETGGRRRSRFDGWLQLISALERAAAEVRPPTATGCPAPAPGDGPAVVEDEPG